MEYHWTAHNRREFLLYLAESGSVLSAAAHVGMSSRAAYYLRARSGKGFRLAWDAAIILARAAVEGMLLDRAIHGDEVITIKEPEGNTTRRHSKDRGLGLHLLTRLDRKCAEMDAGTPDAPAQLVADVFEDFLTFIETDPDNAAITAFVEAQRTGKQCELPQETDDSLPPVWQSNGGKNWRTSFPPPPGYQGKQLGRYGENEYQRDCTDEEREAVTSRRKQLDERRRDAWFGFVPVAATNDNAGEPAQICG